MFNTIKVALSAAIVVGTTLPDAAATKHHRAAARRPAIYNMVPGSAGGGCSPIHPPLCSNICSGSGPCAPPDHW